MERLNQYTGLCSNCANAPRCTYPRDAKRPVLECDEYRCSSTPPAPRATQRSRRDAGAPVTPRAEGSAPAAPVGLCSNCDNRQTCVFPKPEGGVWHCEEYQ